MNKTKKTLLGFISILVIVFVTLTFALFLGYFDHGQFEVVQARWSAGRVAMLARRSDHQALSGTETYVIIGDHIFSSHELRNAYYRQKELFSAESNCLNLSWSNSHTLVISCRNGSINASNIGSQKHQAGDVAVVYENIPDVMRR